MCACELPESNLTVGANGPKLACLGTKDSLLANGQQLRMIFKESHFGDDVHAPDNNSGRVKRTRISLGTIHAIIGNIVGMAMLAVELFKSPPDRSTIHATFVKGGVHTGRHCQSHHNDLFQHKLGGRGGLGLQGRPGGDGTTATNSIS